MSALRLRKSDTYCSRSVPFSSFVCDHLPSMSYLKLLVQLAVLCIFEIAIKKLCPWSFLVQGGMSYTQKGSFLFISTCLFLFNSVHRKK